MRVLLLSDTHGELAAIDERARDERCEAVVHAGDFGFYDDASVGRLEARELFLRVVHSALPEEEKARARKLKGPKLAGYVRERGLLGEMPAHLREGRGFAVPVYAVWGNHEDRAVLGDLLAGRSSVPNLHLLAPGEPRRVGPFALFGLGGNVLSERLSDETEGLAGEGGKVWSTLAELGRLAEAMERPREPGEVRVLVTHVSPGKEPLAARLAALLGADLAVSGHMGSPYCCVWSEFAVRDEADARAWLDRTLGYCDGADVPGGLAARGLRLLRELPGDVTDARGNRVPPWYRGVFYVNLPDAADGHAVLTWDGRRAGLETRSRGRAVLA